MRVVVVVMVCAAATLAEPARLTAADEMAAYLMDQTQELQLASTAGPAGVTKDATYWTLARDGYRVAREGGNGFHCFVERSWGGPDPNNAISFDPRVRAPHCINAEGSRTTMREYFLIARLALEGKSSDQINAAVDAALAMGELQLPKQLSLTYMMSKHQWLGEGASNWKPHLMLWLPGLERADLGPAPSGMLVGKPGSHRSCLVMVMPEFIE